MAEERKACAAGKVLSVTKKHGIAFDGTLGIKAGYARNPIKLRTKQRIRNFDRIYKINRMGSKKINELFSRLNPVNPVNPV